MVVASKHQPASSFSFLLFMVGNPIRSLNGWWGGGGTPIYFAVLTDIEPMKKNTVYGEKSYF
jgi:hypothetical protein